MNGKTTYSAIKFDVLINSNMSFKCSICTRTFSRCTAYSQHVQRCIKKLEVEEDDDVEIDTESSQDSNYENDNIEVIMLFKVILIRLVNLKNLCNFRPMMIMKYKICHLTVSKVLKVLKVCKVI